jgi:hypothetical protein
VIRSHLSERGSKRVTPKNASLQRRISTARAQAAADEIVADLRVGVAREDLYAACGVAVLRMAKEKGADAPIWRLRLEREPQRRHVSRNGERLLQLGARLGRTHAKAGFELFFRHVPEQRGLIGLREVHGECPPVAAIDIGQQTAAALIAIDIEDGGLIGRHLIRQIVHKSAMGLQQQRHRELLAFERKLALGPSIDLVPGM